MKQLVKSTFICIFSFLVLSYSLTGQKSYYVSPIGDDSNEGTISQPFRSINYTLGKMTYGDTCILRGGTYREEIIVNTPGIMIKSFPGEYVLVTGCDSVESVWEDYINPLTNVKCKRAKFTDKTYQLFTDGKLMMIARWPNKTSSMLSMEEWAPSVMDAKGSDKKVSITQLPQAPDNFWKGGYYIGVNDEGKLLATWYSGGGRISSSSGTTLQITETCYGVGSKQANGNGFGYIINCLNALDTDNEWFWDGKYIYLKPPASIQEATKVEARTRLYILTINSQSVSIEGINFKAGAVKILGDGATIEDCTFRYTSPFVWNSGNNSDESGARCNWGDFSNGSSGIYVKSNGVKFKDCYVANSWFNGIVLWGNSCLVENCIIENVNWIGKRCSGINSYGKDNIIRYCTIKHTGASSIEGGNGKWLEQYAIRNIWEHNLCEDACKLVVDQGFFYVNHQDGANPFANSEWRYNLLIHNGGPNKGEWKKTLPALYVDNSSSGYKVHHNVIVDCREGLRYNDTREGEHAGKEIYFFNNTFYKVDTCLAYEFWNSILGKDYAKPDVNLHFKNNLGIESGNYIIIHYVDTTFGPTNVEFAPKICVVDADNMDFRLVENSNYIDAGEIIEGINMEYAGEAPDIGAYEKGLPTWKAGAELVIPVFPDGPL